MKVICTRCGGTNIACEAIVNPNTGKIIDYLDESFMHANCGDCKEEVVITDVDRVKKDIDSMFFKFVKRYFLLDIICLMMAAWLLSPVNWSLSKRLSRNTRRSEQACLIGMFGEYLEV